jgi:hypothetical protein
MRTELVLEWSEIGNDLVVTLEGGRKHVGAVAVGHYDKKSGDASSSVITLPGHRDDEIALYGARRVSACTKTATVFIVGIHLDDITVDEITEIVDFSKQMINRLIESLKERVS